MLGFGDLAQLLEDPPLQINNLKHTSEKPGFNFGFHCDFLELLPLELRR